MCGLVSPLGQFSIPAKSPGPAPAISCNADSMLKTSSALAQACHARHASALNVVALRHPGIAGPSHAFIKTTPTRSAPNTSSGHAPSLGSRRQVAVHVWPFDQAWAPSPEVCMSNQRAAWPSPCTSTLHCAMRAYTSTCKCSHRTERMGGGTSQHGMLVSSHAHTTRNPSQLPTALSNDTHTHHSSQMSASTTCACPCHCRASRLSCSPSACSPTSPSCSS